MRDDKYVRSDGARVIQERRSAIWTLARQNQVVDVTTERGSFRCYMPRDDVWVTEATGHITADMIQTWMDTYLDEYRGGPAQHSLHDWSAIESYEPSARPLLTEYGKETRDEIASAHFYIRNRLVQMALSTGGLALSFFGVELQAYANGADFDRAIGKYFL